MVYLKGFGLCVRQQSNNQAVFQYLSCIFSCCLGLFLAVGLRSSLEMHSLCMLFCCLPTGPWTKLSWPHTLMEISEAQTHMLCHLDFPYATFPSPDVPHLCELDSRLAGSSQLGYFGGGRASLCLAEKPVGCVLKWMIPRPSSCWKVSLYEAKVILSV